MTAPEHAAREFSKMLHLVQDATSDKLGPRDPTAVQKLLDLMKDSREQLPGLLTSIDPKSRAALNKCLGDLSAHLTKSQQALSASRTGTQKRIEAVFTARRSYVEQRVSYTDRGKSGLANAKSSSINRVYRTVLDEVI